MMMSRRASAVALALVLASCGGSGGVAPQLPTAPSVAPASAGNASGFELVSSQGVAPEGFELKMRLDPHPSEDGIIHDTSPATVNVDLCGSTPDPGKTLRFYFDWDKDGRADVEGTGDDCAQKHTYRIPSDATKAVVLESNVCVTNGDPNVHDGSVYFSCRAIRVSLPAKSASSCTPGLAEGCYPVEGFGSVYWSGGTGPTLDVAAFDGPDCEGEAFPPPFYVVMACSDSEAAALCADFFAEFPVGGHTLYACLPFDSVTTASRPWSPTRWKMPK